MEKSVYLLLGTKEERTKPSLIQMGVDDAINCMLEVAESYGVEFSDVSIQRLRAELAKHIKNMKG
nr:hypothetical protein [Mitsuokella multacida]